MATSPEQIADLMRPIVADEVQEVLYVFSLNTKNACIAMHEVTRGLVDSAHSHAREVFRHAIVDSASRIALVHNHPSGDPVPSHQDTVTTKKLVEAGQIIGIEVVDHVVIGKRTANRDSDWYSMRVSMPHLFEKSRQS